MRVRRRRRKPMKTADGFSMYATIKIKMHNTMTMLTHEDKWCSHIMLVGGCVGVLLSVDQDE
tara:strand:+ start:376 stop:561 length:186 start_codon:yes stop_codon:yes gene_type:complete